MYGNNQIASWKQFLCALEIRFPSIHGADYSPSALILVSNLKYAFGAVTDSVLPADIISDSEIAESELADAASVTTDALSDPMPAESCLPSPIFVSDLEFDSHSVTDFALDSATPSEPDSADFVSEKCDSSSQSSYPNSNFIFDLDSVIDSDGDSSYGMITATATYFPQFSTLPKLKLFDMGTATMSPKTMVMNTLSSTASRHLNHMFDPGGDTVLNEEERLAPPPLKPPHRSLQTSMVEFQVTSDLTMPPPPLEPPDVNYGGVVSASVHEYFSHPFDVDALFVSVCYHLKATRVLRNDVPALSFCSKFVEMRTAWKLFAERSKRLDTSEFFLALVVGTTMIHVFSVGGFFEHGKRKTTTEFISMSTLFDAHHVLERRPLSRTCYFSLATGCLQFKPWDPGTNVASSPSESFVSFVKKSLNKMRWATSLCCIYSEIFADSNLPTIRWNDSHSADHNDAREFFLRLADMQVMARYTSSGEGLTAVHRFGHCEFVVCYFPHPYNFENKGEMEPLIQDSNTNSIYFYDLNKGNMCGFTIRGLKFIVPVCCLISFVDRLTCNIFTNPIVLPHAYTTPASLVANNVKVGSIQQGMEESTNLQVNDAQKYVGDLWLKCSLLLVILCAYWASPFVKNKIKERLYSFDADARSNIVKIQITPGVLLLVWKENSHIGSLHEAVTYICLIFDSLVQYTLLFILERSLLACIPMEEFGERHLEPNLTYAKDFVIGLGLGNLVSIYIDRVSHATALEVTECAKEGSIKIDFYLVSVGSNTYIQNYCVNDLHDVRSISRQQWHPGEHFQMSKVLWSFQFKQWDPGRFIHEENFYNLEDKVDFEGVGNDTVMGLGGAASNTILWRLLGLLNSPLQFLGVSFSYALWLIYSL